MVSPERGEEERCFQTEGRGKIAPPARSPLPPLNPETQIISTQADETIHMLVITADSLLFSSSPQTQLPVLCSREHLKLPVGQMVIMPFSRTVLNSETLSCLNNAHQCQGV